MGAPFSIPSGPVYPKLPLSSLPPPLAECCTCCRALGQLEMADPAIQQRLLSSGASAATEVSAELPQAGDARERPRCPDRPGGCLRGSDFCRPQSGEEETEHSSQKSCGWGADSAPARAGWRRIMALGTAESTTVIPPTIPIPQRCPPRPSACLPCSPEVWGNPAR